MTPYDCWAKRHRTKFGFHSDDDIKMVTSWESLLAEFSVHDLDEATDAIARTQGDKTGYRHQHLSMLLTYLQQKRADVAAKENERREQQFATATCLECGGAGLVPVPHPAFVRDGVLMRLISLTWPAPAAPESSDSVLSMEDLPLSDPVTAC